MSKTSHKIVTLTLVTAAALTLTACTPIIHTQPNPTHNPTVHVEDKDTQPVIIDISKADGETCTTKISNIIMIDLKDTDATNWKQTNTNPEIAFFPNTDKEALYEPSIIPNNPGETNITLTNTMTGQTITFTVQVIG